MTRRSDDSLRQHGLAEQLFRRRVARRSFLDFCQFIRPDFIVGRHHRLIAEKLEQVVRGECKRLMVFMPPRHGKSMMISQLFPSWAFGQMPDLQIIEAGYSQDIALEQSRRAREVFISDEMGILFPDLYYEPQKAGQKAIAIPRQAAHEWGTVQGGRYYAAGVGGGITGFGSDIFIIDDPVKDRADANSRIMRDKAWDWARPVMRSRLSPRLGAVILVQTRWHHDDLAGRFISAMNTGEGDQWDILSLPAIDKDGKALWPEFWPIEQLHATKIALGEYEWNALYQQTPTVESGAIYLKDWWAGKNRYDIDDPSMRNSAIARWQLWDTAFKDNNSSDYSACITFDLLPDYRIAVRHVHQERLIFPDLIKRASELANDWAQDGKLQSVVIEDKASGQSLIQTMRETGPARLASLVEPLPLQGSKEAHGSAASAWCANGSVILPHPSPSCPWLFKFEEELYKFPMGAHDDMADIFSKGILYLENYLAEGLDARMSKLRRANTWAA